MTAIRKALKKAADILLLGFLVVLIGILPAVYAVGANAQGFNGDNYFAPRVEVRVGSTIRDHLRRVLNPDSTREQAQAPARAVPQDQYPHALQSAQSPQLHQSPQTEGDVAIGFSPGTGVSLVIKTIQSATQTLDVAAYEFTHQEIAQAIVNALKRGVHVRVLIDQERANGSYNAAQFFANSGVPTRVSNPRYKIFHHKFIVADSTTLQTGSFNYTTAAAKHNAENVIVMLNAPAASARFTREYERLWNESTLVRARY